MSPTRRSFRRIAAAILASVLLTGATGLLHARAWDVCDILPAPHDPDAHRWTNDVRSYHTDGDHCYLCHWLRSLRLAPALIGRLVAGSDASDRVGPMAVLSEDRQSSSRLPARSPPFSILVRDAEVTR